MKNWNTRLQLQLVRWWELLWDYWLIMLVRQLLGFYLWLLVRNLFFFFSFNKEPYWIIFHFYIYLTIFKTNQIKQIILFPIFATLHRWFYLHCIGERVSVVVAACQRHAIVVWDSGVGRWYWFDDHHCFNWINWNLPNFKKTKKRILFKHYCWPIWVMLKNLQI